jgi:nucleoside-diphosphate-sugar epimerase
LISRLRFRQFGIFVTTSYLATQAYKEIREDGHPVVVLAARDIADLLKSKSAAALLAVAGGIADYEPGAEAQIVVAVGHTDTALAAGQHTIDAVEGRGYVPRMKILVTGATGKVGSRLAKRLAQRGDQVRALVRDPARAADLREARIELAEGDLLKADSLAAAVRGVDAVVHCAAFFRGATPEQAQAVNELGTQHLASAARAASVRRFIFTSTGLVYGSNGGRLAGEDDPCAPTAAYPVSKLAAERFLLAIEGLDVRVLRLPFVYGDGDPHIAEIIPLRRSFPPTDRMSIGHHADIAQAVGLVLDAPSPPHRIYNVVDDEAPDLATLFASVGAPPPDGSNAEPARGFSPLLDGRRIREDLGFKPKFPRLADAIAAGA